MIEVAKEKYPDIHFSMQDGEGFSLIHNFMQCSLMLRFWMKNKQKVVQNCYEVLLPGGRFVAELERVNNIQSIVDAIKDASNRLSILYDATVFP